MKPLNLLICLLFSILSFSQSKIIVLDSLNQSPVNRALLMDEKGNYIGETDENGKIEITNRANLYISHKNYKNLITNTDSGVKYLTRNTVQINEVVISKLPLIKKGCCVSKKSFPIRQIATANKDTLTLATKFELLSKSQLKTYNFFIKSKYYNAPFLFLIYDSKEGIPNKILYTQIIDNYTKGWNKKYINDLISLQEGEYFIGMKWIPNYTESDLYSLGEMKNKITKYGYGHQLGIADCECKERTNFIFKKTWKPTHQYMNKENAFGQYLEIYED